jgi:hypothetical protein
MAVLQILPELTELADSDRHGRGRYAVVIMFIPSSVPRRKSGLCEDGHEIRWIVVVQAAQMG